MACGTCVCEICNACVPEPDRQGSRAGHAVVVTLIDVARHAKVTYLAGVILEENDKHMGMNDG